MLVRFRAGRDRPAPQGGGDPGRHQRHRGEHRADGRSRRSRTTSLSMVELAHAHGIRVVLSSVLPVHNYTPPRAHLSPAPAGEDPAPSTAGSKDHAAANRCVNLDYFGGDGGRAWLPQVGAGRGRRHPTRAGFAAMAPLAPSKR